MKRLVLLVLGVTAVATGAYAQSNAELIEGALAAAPVRARDAAGVIQWNADFTYETLKEGTNRIVCYHRSDEARRQPFAVQCTSVANLERVAQSRRFRAEAGQDAAAERAMVDEAEANGTRIAPEFGSFFTSMNGPDQASARSHTTIAVPGATTESLGLPDNPGQGGAWLMAVGTTTAHIMIPGH